MDEAAEKMRQNKFLARANGDHAKAKHMMANEDATISLIQQQQNI